jgi:hypothetical protein
MDRSRKPVRVTVSIADDHLDKIAEVVVGLRGAGLRVDEVLDAVGVVIGTVDPDDLEALESVRGVAGVELQHSVRLAPPDAEIQ